MASKTAGAAEKMNGGSGKMEDVAERMEDVCNKFAPISQIVEARLAQLFAQAGDVQMVSK